MFKKGLFLCIITLFINDGNCLKEYSVDIGQNVTIPCPLHNTNDVMWVKEGRHDRPMIILDNGALFLNNSQKDDAGIYSCTKENVVNIDDKAEMKVIVRTPPPALANVVVRPSSIIALIIWEVNSTGGYPIINFTAQYRLAGSKEDWLPISPNHITPNSRQIDVYKLQPNTTYEFRIWATNQLGRGEITEVIATTSHEYQEEELARRMLAGADKFDTRMWAVAVGIVMGSLILLGMGTCFMLYQECRLPNVTEEQEIIELVPNIILNPGFDGNATTTITTTIATPSNNNNNNNNNNNTQQNRMSNNENLNNDAPIRLQSRHV